MPSIQRGFSTRELLQLLRQLRVPLLGADLVEYNPDQDINEMTAMLCARLFRELAAHMCTHPLTS